jgi:hypothetical protein
MPSPGPSEEILDPRSVPREASFKLEDGKADEALAAEIIPVISSLPSLDG